MRPAWRRSTRALREASCLLLVLALCCLAGCLTGCAAKSPQETAQHSAGQTDAGGQADATAAAAKAGSGQAGSGQAAGAPNGPLLRYSADFVYAPGTAGTAPGAPAGADNATEGTTASAPTPNATATTKASSTKDTTGTTTSATPRAPTTPTPKKSPAAAPPPELLRALNAASLLLKLQDSPPDDLQGLEFRIDKDEAEAKRLLQAFGYYDGTVQRTVLAPDAVPPAAEQGAGAAASGSSGLSASPASAGVSGPAGASGASGPAGASAPSAPSASAGVSGPSGPSGLTDAAPARRNAALWRVRLTLTPGQRYTVGETVVRYVEDPATAASSASAAAAPSPSAPASASAPASPATPASSSTMPDALAALPSSLEDAGLAAGTAAEASRILRAVERLPDILGQRGYPLAEVKGTRYAVDKETRQLFATVLVQAGPRARMGRVVVRGESQVQPAYLEKLRPWEEGVEWDQRLVEDYRDLLVRQGLFRSIELQPEPAATATAAPSPRDLGPVNTAPTAHAGGADGSGAAANSGSAPAPGVAPAPAAAVSSPEPLFPSASALTPSGAATPTPVYDLVATLADAPQRTVGGGLNYESNRGPGVQAYWEHRNLLGQGERFRAEASVWQDSQFARATFRKPAFLDRSQELTAEAWLRNEDTDAYNQRAAWISGGLERRLWGPLFASAGVAVEGGDLQDPTHPLRGYTMAGVPLQIRYEGASGPGGSQLDPERGLRATLGVRPSWGEYAGSFFITPTRLSLSGYVPVGSVGVDPDTGRVIPRVVLAARGAAGTLWRGDSQRIPASARYYGGGGGSVRGYAYQSLGPRDANNDPLGGASFAELSLEARVRITENIAIVPFLDGGNVYSGVTPGFERDGTSTGLQWGAGLGLRYHTAVGPLRLDVATPINPRKDDGTFFLYISIGQSF